MNEVSKQDILLESGTNEMEIIEFYLGEQSFGINVQKLREIIQYEPEKKVALPDSPPSMLGTLLVRGNTIPLVDLNRHLQRRTEAKDSSAMRQVVLICEFNGRITGFLVDGVNQIHRISWTQVSPMAEFIGQYRPRFTGSVNVDGREILIVDLEYILAEIDPDTALSYDESADVGASEGAEEAKENRLKRRSQVGLMIAEDSAIIRAGLVEILKKAGYHSIQTFIDGEQCFDAINHLKHDADRNRGGDLSGDLDLLISDIEMPGMDGLTLCRKLREDLRLKELPVLMFSSLINEQMAHKCDSVGATGYISKPQIPLLIEMIDGYCMSS
ncbi:MAG TPA: chemotaxis protein [Desulfuromonadales bacterium]|nr:chemotaxis protein [Desulfuromonadales bacterium]